MPRLTHPVSEVLVLPTVLHKVVGIGDGQELAFDERRAVIFLLALERREDVIWLLLRCRVAFLRETTWTHSKDSKCVCLFSPMGVSIDLADRHAARIYGNVTL